MAAVVGAFLILAKTQERAHIVLTTAVALVLFAFGMALILRWN